MMNQDVQHSLSPLRAGTRLLVLFTIALGVSAPAGFCQTPARAALPALAVDQASTLKRLETLRDAFVKHTAASGLTCSIAPPKVSVENVKSFGQYDDETNTLRSPAWGQLDKEQKDFFFQMAGPGADEQAAERNFESGTHRWVFVHEMGHWWQACQHSNTNKQHYEVEYGANRIAAAYWRDTDPAYATRIAGRFQSILDHAPSPVPAGAADKQFFNDNYDKLAGTFGYTWFQSKMVVTAFAEKPAPTFPQALKTPTP